MTSSLEKIAAKMIQGFKEEIRILQTGLRHHYLESPEPEIEKIERNIKILEEKTFIPTPLAHSEQPSSPRSDDFLHPWKDFQP